MTTRCGTTLTAPGVARRVFAGEVEPCINGRVVTVGSYYGVDVQPVVDRLLGEQMADGGWNCEQENGSTRGSFHTTINVLEGLLEHQQATGGSTAVGAALVRGHEYLLERHLLRRLSNGELIDPAFTQFSYPDRLPLRRPARSRAPARGRGRRRTRAWTRRSTSFGSSAILMAVCHWRTHTRPTWSMPV